MAVQLELSPQKERVLLRLEPSTSGHAGGPAPSDTENTEHWVRRVPARPLHALPTAPVTQRPRRYIRHIIAIGFALNFVIIVTMLLQARAMILDLQLRNELLSHQLDEQLTMVANTVAPSTENKMTALVTQEQATRQDAYILALQDVLRQQNGVLTQKNVDIAQKNVDIAQKSAELAQKTAELGQKNAELGQKAVDIKTKDASIDAQVAQVAQKEEAISTQSSQLSDVKTQLSTVAGDRDKSKQSLEKEQLKSALLQKDKEQLTARVDEVAKQNSQLRWLIGVDDLRPFSAEAALASGGRGGAYGVVDSGTANGAWDIVVGTVVARQKGNADLIQRLQSLLRNLNSEDQTFLRREWLRRHGTDPNRIDIWPIFGGITQRFGPTSWDFEGPAVFQGRHYDHFHTGLDIMTGVGTPVHATADGVVVFAGRDASDSNTVMIRHAGGYETLFFHNSRLFVQAGDRVSKAETIALSGDSGHSTGPHVHYEVRHNGALLDPYATLIDS